MALTNSGFDGTVTEAAWATMSALTDVDAVESSAAWAVTQGTGRQVSTAAHSGYAFARGVLSKDTAAILTNLPTPTNGQWFLIVRHIDWSVTPADGVTVVAIAHTTTTTTIPTVAPTTFPTVGNNPGVLYDHKLGWAWVRSSDTTMVLFDLRDWDRPRTVRAASDAIRGALIPSPVMGDTCIRTDKGWTESYYTLYNSSTNPGGTTPAGWYPVPGSLIFCDLAYNGTFVDSSEQPPAWTEQSDIQGWHAAGATSVIPTIRGRYAAVSTTGWGSGATGARRVRLRKNGSSDPSGGGVISDASASGTASGTPGSSLAVSAVLMNGSSDYFDVVAFQNQGAAINIFTRLVVRYEGPPVGP